MKLTMRNKVNKIDGRTKTFDVNDETEALDPPSLWLVMLARGALFFVAAASLPASPVPGDGRRLRTNISPQNPSRKYPANANTRGHRRLPSSSSHCLGSKDDSSDGYKNLQSFSS